MKSIPLYPKVLIVTQQLIIAADLYIQLTKMKFHLLGICNSSTDALLALKNSQPDVVIIDAGLKGSIDGIKLGSIVGHDMDLPFIFLNPGLNENRLSLAIAAKASAIVNTPLNIEGIALLIHQITRKCMPTLNMNLKYCRSDINPYRSEVPNGLYSSQA